jgi:hypothetical protein
MPKGPSLLRSDDTVASTSWLGAAVHKPRCVDEAARAEEFE